MRPDGLKCSFCGEDDASMLEVDTIKKTFWCKSCGRKILLSSILVDSKGIESLRKQLRDAMSEKYISGEKVKGIAQELLTKDSNGLLANFCNAAYSDDSQQLNSFIDNIDSNQDASDVEIIIEFLINDLKIENVVSLKNLVNKFRLNANYIDTIENEAEKLDEGIYNSLLKRDIFIAFAGADESRVVPIVNYFEAQGFSCYFSLRNLRHGANAKEVYWNELYKALANSKCVVFCSSNNSRKNSCDALTELAYVSDTLNKKDNMDIGMFEFILDEYTSKTPLLMKNTLKEYFDNKTYYTDIDALSLAVLKFIQNKKIDRIKKTVGDDEVAATNTAKSTNANDNNAFDISGTKLMKYRGNSERVVIPNGVTIICSDAFAGCSNLTEVVIPRSVKSIGGFAFSKCNRLISVSIPSSVTSIGGCAFAGCSSLVKIEIPSSVMSVGVNTFRGCGDLTIYCESCAKPSGWDNAWNCDKRPVVWDCKNNNGGFFSQVKSAISKGLNQAADVITKATDTFTQEIGKATGSITKKPTPTNSRPVLLDYDKAEFQIVGTQLKRYKGNKADVVIPDGVTIIDSFAFKECSSLVSVVIPSSVLFISQYAFMDCRSLTSISYPNNVKGIGNGAFNGCSGLTSIEIPSGVKSIGNFTFFGCRSLSSIKIPSSITSIGEDAFCYCNSLTSIEIPSSVTSIDKDAFCYCSNLTSIRFGGTKKTWKHINNKSKWKEKGRTIYCIDGNIEC